MQCELNYDFDVIQGSKEWIEMKLGILSASEFKNIITPSNLKFASNQSSKLYLDKLLSERIDSRVYEGFYNDDMMRGHEDEAYAVEAYENKYGEKVRYCGFITNTKTGGKLGYSPDGLVGEDGLIEIKSRLPKHQTKTILDHVLGRTKDLIPSEYMMQCQSALFISERKWIDFISYCNGHPMVTIRVEPIPEFQDAINESAVKVENILQENLEKYLEAIETDTRLTKTEYIERQEIIV